MIRLIHASDKRLHSDCHFRLLLADRWHSPFLGRVLAGSTPRSKVTISIAGVLGGGGAAQRLGGHVAGSLAFVCGPSVMSKALHGIGSSALRFGARLPWPPLASFASSPCQVRARGAPLPRRQRARRQALALRRRGPAPLASPDVVVCHVCVCVEHRCRSLPNAIRQRLPSICFGLLFTCRISGEATPGRPIRFAPSVVHCSGLRRASLHRLCALPSAKSGVGAARRSHDADGEPHGNSHTTFSCGSASCQAPWPVRQVL